MFTGIIQALGTIKKLDNRGNDIRLTVSSPTLDMSDVALGDSIATNGVCLTVTDMGPDYYCADVSAGTIKLTGFAHYSAGSTVNLEKAMRPSDRLGGHIVSGHVDGVAKLIKSKKIDESHKLTFECPEKLLKFIAVKGSVALNGTSLTVNDVSKNIFTVNIIPHTKQVTTWKDSKTGDLFNLEIDLLARYMDRLQAGTK